MTPQEQAQHRETLRNMNTEQERNKYREEHHKAMQERARQQGIGLPERPQPDWGRNGGGIGGRGRGR
jgi:hypothetical protein